MVILSALGCSVVGLMAASSGTSRLEAAVLAGFVWLLLLVGWRLLPE